MDLRKTALAATVLLGLDRALWISGQIRVFGAVPRLPWNFVLLFLVNMLILLPLPVLLALVYFTGMPAAISPRLRIFAGATALLHTGSLAGPQAYRFVRELHRNAINIGYFGGTTPAAKIWGWLRSSEAGPVLVAGLRLMTGVAFLLFLVALAVPSRKPAEADPLRLPLLKRAARAAVLAGCLTILMTLAGQVYAAVAFRPELVFGVFTRIQLIIRNAFSLVPALGWYLGALIVYLAVLPENVGQS